MRSAWHHGSLRFSRSPQQQRSTLRANLGSFGAGLIAIVAALLFIIVPNRFPIVAGGALSLAWAVASFDLRNYTDNIALRTLGLTSIVTIAFIAVGAGNGAYSESYFQILIIYLAAPAMWLVVCAHALRNIGAHEIARYISLFALALFPALALYYFSFSSGLTQLTGLFITADANTQVDRSMIGARMHMFGAMTFICGAVLAAPDVCRRASTQVILFASLIACAIGSGRSALLVSCAIGLLIYLPHFLADRLAVWKKVLFVGMLIGIGIIAIDFVSARYGISISSVIRSHYLHISGGGGAARDHQNLALIDGIIRTNGLGAGHGVGVGVVRSLNFPWRYESIGLATVFRTGVFGLLAYMVPFILAYAVAAKKVARGSFSALDRFYAGGLTAALFAAATNPYIEAFSFQWIYVLPVCYFLNSRTDRALSVIRRPPNVAGN